MVSEASDLSSRPAGVEDVAFLSDLRNTLAQHFISQDPATPELTLEMLRQSHTYVIERGKERVGAFSIYDVHGGQAEFGRFMVTPEEQGNGVGAWALEEAFAVARSNKIAQLWLTVRRDNAVAMDLYTRQGFVIVRHHADGIVMRRPL